MPASDTSTPGSLGGPQTNDLNRGRGKATVVLSRLYAILEEYFSRGELLRFTNLCIALVCRTHP